MTSLSAKQIYDNFHTNAQGTSGLAQGQQGAQSLAAKLQDRALAAQKLVNGIQADWRGTAAEGASQGLTPFAVNAFQNHQQLGSGVNVMSSQMDAFQTAVSEVQPVPPAPQMQDVLFAMSNGSQNLTPLQAQFAQYNAVQQANIDAYNKYVASSRANSSVPSIMPITPPDAPIAVVAAPAASTSPAGSVSVRPPHAHPALPGGRAVDRSARSAGSSPAGSTAPPSAGTTSAVPTAPATTTTPSTSTPPATPSVPGTPEPGSPGGPGDGTGPSLPSSPGEPVVPIGPVVGLGTGTPGNGDANVGDKQTGGEAPGLLFGWGIPGEEEVGAGSGSLSYRSGIGGGTVVGPRSGQGGGWADEPAGPRSAVAGNADVARDGGAGEPVAPPEGSPAFAPVAPSRGFVQDEEHDRRLRRRDDEEPDDEAWGIVDQVAPSVIGATLAAPALDHQHVQHTSVS